MADQPLALIAFAKLNDLCDLMNLTDLIWQVNAKHLTLNYFFIMLNADATEHLFSRNLNYPGVKNE